MSLAVGVAPAEAIVRVARQFPVFPCRRTPEEVTIGGKPRLLKAKTPLVARGFHAATQDVEQIRAWWAHWPDALAAIPTGSLTRLVVIDYDTPKSDAAGREWLEAHTDELMSTRSHETLSGGRHYLFRAPDGVKYRSGVCVELAGTRRGGIDIRAEGGYVIYWPLHGGSTSGEIAALPAGLLDERKIEARALPALPTASPAQWKRDRQILLNVLPYLDPTDYDQWITTGMATHLCSGASDDGFAIWHAWSAGELTGTAPANYSGIEDCRYRWSSFSAGGNGGNPIGLGSLVVAAKANGFAGSMPTVSEQSESSNPCTLEDIWAYMPQHTYLYVPTREMWPASSVNSRVPPIDIGTEKPLKASAWLDQNRAVEQMTWAPGLPLIVENQLIADGGWFERSGARTFNLYRPPVPLAGDAREAAPWIAHIQRVYPAEADHIIRWLAHRVQHPEIKLNHALVIGGPEGIGKDTILKPVIYAVGAWNFAEVTPIQLLGRFNGFIKSVILRMSEARDLGDVDRYALHEHLKQLIAAPPDILRCDEKNLREHAVVNVCGVIITSNHIDGLYIPADSRRYYVAWSDTTREETDSQYWIDLNYWYEHENGLGHVCAYLRELDLSDWNPKAPPPKTPAFWRVVDAGRAPEDAELADALDAIQWPPAVTVSQLCVYASDPFREWLQDRRNARQLPHRMEAAGYIAVRNDGAKDGQWVIMGKRQTVYAKRELTIRDRISEARTLAAASRG